MVDQAINASREGITILILSDRDITQGQLVIPAAMATGAVHHGLIEKGLRTESNLVIETGDAFS